jgi:hypothetical protein
MTRTDSADLREIDEALSHAVRARNDLRSKGQLRMAEVAERKVDTLLDLRLIATLESA